MAKVKKTSKSGGSKKKSKFVYKAPTEEQVKRRGEQQGGNFEGIFKNDVTVYKIKGGENCIRILPPTWDNHEHCGYEVFVHGFIGPNNATFLCPAKMKNERCPICEASAEAKQSGDDDEAYALQAKKRVLFWIIDRDDESAGPIIFDVGWMIDRDIFALAIHKRSGKVRLLDHPDKGHDVTFKRQGEGIKTRYFGFEIDPEGTPIFKDEEDQDKVLELIQDKPIPDLLVYRDAEYLDKVLSGTAASDDDDDDDDDDDEEEEKTSSKRKVTKKPASKKKKPRDEEDDDDDDEDDDDDDDDDPDEDDGDEDQDDDDDEDEDDDDEDDDEDEDGDDDDGDEDEDDDEDETPPKKSSKRQKVEPKKPARSSKPKPAPKKKSGGSARAKRFGR